jgi:transcriptional regulator with XRE-family HTH domain
MTQWDGDMHARIAVAIKEARGKRSAQWLADQTAELGYPITRAQIANYESGRKKGLDVAELVVLAAALDVPPIALLYPALPDGPVEWLPGVYFPSHVVAEWFSGETELTHLSAERLDPPAKAAELVKAVRERAELLNSAEHLQLLYQKLQHDQGSWEESTSGVRIRDDIARLEARIRAAGGVIDA